MRIRITTDHLLPPFDNGTEWDEVEILGGKTITVKDKSSGIRARVYDGEYEIIESDSESNVSENSESELSENTDEIVSEILSNLGVVTQGLNSISLDARREGTDVILSRDDFERLTVAIQSVVSKTLVFLAMDNLMENAGNNVMVEARRGALEALAGITDTLSTTLRRS